jgi:hypothetical protein
VRRVVLLLAVTGTLLVLSSAALARGDNGAIGGTDGADLLLETPGDDVILGFEGG